MSTIKLNSPTIQFKGIWGVLATVAILVGGGFFAFLNHSNLVEAAETQIEKQLKLELPSMIARKGSPHMMNSELMKDIQNFKITEIHAPWFPNKKRADVRAEVSSKVGDFTFYYRFKRILGSWKLQHETSAPIF